jgi:pimeloyl-ACP methyl ester carboxylesterase
MHGAVSCAPGPNKSWVKLPEGKVDPRLKTMDVRVSSGAPMILKTFTGQRAVSVLSLLCLLVLLSPATIRAATGGVRQLQGDDAGAAYRIQVPATWNGTLLLFSHGYVPPDSSNPAVDAPDAASAAWLLDHGYALAGSSYGATGWAVAQALPAQIRLLDTFNRRVGRPRRIIAWGQSLGGLITAGLIQRYPERFSAALPMCGVLGGGIANWNNALDVAVAFKTLLAPASSLQLTQSTQPGANLMAAELILLSAQSTAQGRARLALVAAVADAPGWVTPSSPAPAPTDYLAQVHNQITWDAQVVWPFIFDVRAELEHRAGGNPSWTTGVSFAALFAHSIDQREVRALYRQAGLSLTADLARLQHAPPIAADPRAVSYLRQNIDLTGNLQVPVLTMHTTADGLVPVANEQDYARVVRLAGKSALLRQLYVNRAGHCAFTPAEEIAAFQQLIVRLDTGRWAVQPETLNAAAARLGPTLNVRPPAFVPFNPPMLLRPDDH